MYIPLHTQICILKFTNVLTMENVICKIRYLVFQLHLVFNYEWTLALQISFTYELPI